MSILAEAVVTIFQIASALILVYGFTLTIDNGLNRAITGVASLLRRDVAHAKIDGFAHAA